MGDYFAEAATLFFAPGQSINMPCIKNWLASDRANPKRTLSGRPHTAKYGGITYIHRFGSTLNAHLHYHSCLIDGVFAQTENGLRFYETVGLTQKVIQSAQETIRKRLLRLFVRCGLLSSDESEQMLT